jgi:hypothetical protein
MPTYRLAPKSVTLSENQTLHIFFFLRLHLTFALNPASDLRGGTHC